MTYKNKERRNARISLFIMTIGLLAFVLPYFLGADMMDYGYAIAFIGAILALTFFIVYFLFRGRAKVLDKMFYNENILAYWHYSKEFWDKEKAQDEKDSGIAKVVGFFLGGIFLIIGIVIFAVDPEENGLFLAIMAVIGVFFIAIGFIAAANEKRKAARILPEAIIAKEGVLYKDILYTWNSKFAFLESVSLNPSDPGTLLFVLRQLGGSHVASGVRYRRYSVGIPIPPGEESTANGIIDYFNMPIQQGYAESMQEEPD
ncbi:MAG: hypothetical protein ACYCYI_10260 [Saccharofermentanales bacterium]